MPRPSGLAIWSIALLALAATACRSNAPHIEGKRFQRSWADLTGRIDGVFDLSDWQVARGEKLELRYRLDVELGDQVRRNFSGHVKGVWVVWAGERTFDGDGQYRQMTNALMSTTLTTTGVAVETHEALAPSRAAGYFYGTPFDMAEYVPFEKGNLPRDLLLEGTLSREIDEQVPDGLYRFTFTLLFDYFDGAEHAVVPWGLAAFVDQRQLSFMNYATFDPAALAGPTTTFYPRRYLPMVQIGRSEKPRLPWTLFSQISTNGVGGIVAARDQEHFALSTRVRYPSRHIQPPGWRELRPSFPTVFPRSAGDPDMDSVGVVHKEIDHYFDFETGEATISVTTPDGSQHDLGSHAFRGKSWDGPKVDEAPSFDFQQPGRHVVHMTGWIEDELGRRIEGGGDYELWVGNWLTFSTTVKHGMMFPVGASFPFKAEIHPAFPAEVEITVDFFPGSDPARKRTTVVRGRANDYGYFYAHPEQGQLHFDEPGEYRQELSARFEGPRGNHWYGHQVAVGIVENPNSRVALHGMRMLEDASDDLQLNDPLFGYRARWEGEESSPTLSLLEMPDCHDRMLPFHAGDVLHSSSTYSRNANIAAYFSLEPRDPELRRQLTEAFHPTALTMPVGLDEKSIGPDRPLPLKPEATLEVLYLLGERGDMFPIQYQNHQGLHPMLFPKSNSVEAYVYTSVIRPGFSAFVLASDGMPLAAYWATSPNRFGGQLSAGVNGDMPQDLYLVRSGLVYKDLAAGTVDYASYAAAIVIDPNQTDRNRVIEPVTEPLFTLNGQPQWLTLGMASNVVLEVGDRVSLGAGVIPPVPAEVEITLTRPDGSTVERHGRASRLGGFAGGTVVMKEPGVHRVKALAHYKGKTGDVLGSGDGSFNHYVVPEHAPDVLSVELPPVADYDIQKVLTLPLRIRPGFHDAKISYSVIMPGMIMDEGELTPKDGFYPFRFMPSQYAMQFPNFDSTDFGSGRPALNDLVVFVFFVEATGPDGKPAFDAERVVLRGRKLYHTPHPLPRPRPTIP